MMVPLRFFWAGYGLPQWEQLQQLGDGPQCDRSAECTHSLPVSTEVGLPYLIHYPARIEFVLAMSIAVLRLSVRPSIRRLFAAYRLTVSWCLTVSYWGNDSGSVLSSPFTPFPFHSSPFYAQTRTFVTRWGGCRIACIYIQNSTSIYSSSARTFASTGWRIKINIFVLTLLPGQFTPWRFRMSWVSFGAVPTKYDCWQCVTCYMRVCLSLYNFDTLRCCSCSFLLTHFLTLFSRLFVFLQGDDAA